MSKANALVFAGLALAGARVLALPDIKEKLATRGSVAKASTPNIPCAAGSPRRYRSSR